MVTYTGYVWVKGGNIGLRWRIIGIKAWGGSFQTAACSCLGVCRWVWGGRFLGQHQGGLCISKVYTYVYIYIDICGAKGGLDTVSLAEGCSACCFPLLGFFRLRCVELLGPCDDTL